MHTQKNIVHRDIKPANILIGSAKEGILSDFGLALPDLSNLKAAYLKKYQYILHLAPEVNNPMDYTYLSDIYACGATLYRLVNGDNYMPSISPSEAHILSKTGDFPSRTKYRDYVPTSMRKLINKALNIDPGNRFQSAEEMRNALEQQLFVVDWEEAKLRRGILWKGIDKSENSYKVKMIHSTNDINSWDIETTKGKKGKNLRKVSKYCEAGLTKRNAQIKSKKILQKFVTGKS